MKKVNNLTKVHLKRKDILKEIKLMLSEAYKILNKSKAIKLLLLKEKRNN